MQPIESERIFPNHLSGKGLKAKKIRNSYNTIAPTHFKIAKDLTDISLKKKQTHTYKWPI